MANGADDLTGRSMIGSVEFWPRVDWYPSLCFLQVTSFSTCEAEPGRNEGMLAKKDLIMGRPGRAWTATQCTEDGTNWVVTRAALSSAPCVRIFSILITKNTSTVLYKKSRGWMLWTRQDLSGAQQPRASECLNILRINIPPNLGSDSPRHQKGRGPRLIRSPGVNPGSEPVPTP